MFGMATHTSARIRGKHNSHLTDTASHPEGITSKTNEAHMREEEPFVLAFGAIP